MMAHYTFELINPKRLVHNLSVQNITEDPNKERNDPMVAEYWNFGEDLQDAIRQAGYDHPEVEGIAVDLHDLLQASDVIRDLATSESTLAEKLELLQFELAHIQWHCQRAEQFLAAARKII